MAAQDPTEVTPPGVINRHSTTVKWGPLAVGDTCTADQNVGGAVIRSIQIEGTANGGTIAITGSNDGTNFENLNDIGGSAITGKSTGVFLQIQQPSLWIKPVLSGGGASTAITVTLYLVRQF